MAAVAAVLRQQGKKRLEDMIASSFDHPNIARLQGHGVQVRTALLGRPGVPLVVLLRRALKDGHAGAHPHVTSLLSHPELIEAATRRGLALAGWTVNGSEDLRRLQHAGLHAAICDDPGAARAALERPLVLAS